MRTRNSGQPLKTVGTISYSITDCSNSSGSYADLFGTGRYKQMVDRVIDRYHARRKNGEVFFNPMWFFEQEAGRSSGGESLRWPSACGYRTETYFGNTLEWQVGAQTPNALPPVQSIITETEISSLIKELSTRVMSQRGRSDSNLYETLAEVDRSSQIISSNMKNIRKIISDVQKKNVVLRRKLGIAATAADIYLSIRYGILPLVRDTDAIIKGLDRKVRRLRETTRASERLQGASFSTSVYDWSRATRTVGKKYTDDVSIRAMSLDEYYSDVGFNVGFSSKNLLTLPWELIPFSFVVDWFVNVGDFLGSLAPSFGFKNLGSCYVLTRDKSVTFTADSLVGKGTTTVLGFSGSYVYRETTKTRHMGLVSPGIVIKSDFRFDNIFRAADSVALTLQQFRRMSLR